MATKAARAKAKVSKRLTGSLLEAVKTFCAKKGFVSNITKEPGTPEVYGQLGSELKRNIQDTWLAIWCYKTMTFIFRVLGGRML